VTTGYLLGAWAGAPADHLVEIVGRTSVRYWVRALTPTPLRSGRTLGVGGVAWVPRSAVAFVRLSGVSRPASRRENFSAKQFR